MALTDTNLLVRYWLDEAASGTSPTQIDDASGNGYHLTDVNYGSGNMAWVEESGHRGLESTAVTGTQRARRGIDNSSDVIRDALTGSTVGTLEVVMRMDAATSNTSRIIAVGQNRVGATPTWALGALSTTEWRLFGAGGTVATFDPGAGYNSRGVWHIVFDSAQADVANRMRVYKNGSLLSTTNTLTQNAVLTPASDSDLILLNRESSGSYDRSIDGALFYAAVYDEAFDATRASDHYDALIASDDEGGSASIIPQAMASYRQQ